MDERSVVFQLFFSKEGGSNSVNLLYILSSKHILASLRNSNFASWNLSVSRYSKNEYIVEVVIKDEDYRHHCDVKLCPLAGPSHSLNLSKYDKETF